MVMCVAQGCQEPAGSDYNPAWCPKHGKEQADKTAARLKSLEGRTCVVCGEKAGYKKRPGYRQANCNGCGALHNLNDQECAYIESRWNYCPDCNGPLVHQEGCTKCPACGWVRC